MVRETGISNNINRINKKLYTAFNLLTIRAHLFGDSETKTSTVVLVLVFSVHLSSDIIHSAYRKARPKATKKSTLLQVEW